MEKRLLNLIRGKILKKRSSIFSIQLLLLLLICCLFNEVVYAQCSPDVDPPAIDCSTLLEITGGTYADDCTQGSVTVPIPDTDDVCDGLIIGAGTRSDGYALTDPYPVGTTTITWIFTDLAGNSASCTQEVVITSFVPTFDVDLTSSSDASQQILISGNEGKCCTDLPNNNNCAIVNIELNEDSEGFGIEFCAGPNQCSIDLYPSLSCPVENGQGICDAVCATGTEVSILLCKPGEFNDISLCITSTPAPGLNANPEISELCSTGLTVTNMVNPIWSSTDDPNLDYLSDCDLPGDACGSSVTFNYTGSNLTTTDCAGLVIAYQVDGTADSDCSSDPVSSIGTVTLYPEFTIESANAICTDAGSDEVTLSAVLSGIGASCDLDYEWVQTSSGLIVGTDVSLVVSPQNGEEYCLSIRNTNNVEACAIKNICIDATASCCNFEATCNLDATPQVIEGCDVAAIPDPETDYNQVFTDIGSPCGTLVMSNDDAETGSLCPDGITVTRTYTLFDDLDANGELGLGEESVPCVEVFKVVTSIVPTITCSPNITRDATEGTCALIVNDIAPVSTSVGCSGTATINYALSGATELSGMDDASGTTFNVGTTTVTYTVIDDCGQTETCSFDITVEDTEAPVFTCDLADIEGVTDAGLCTSTSITITSPTGATDNCSADGAIVVSGARDDAPLTLSDPFPKGETEITWTFEDEAGNTSTCTQKVVVSDTEAPVFACDLVDIEETNNNADCAATLTIEAPTATDNCDVTITGVGTRDDGALLTAAYPLGTTEITWTFTDESGNDISCTQNVIVENPNISVVSITATNIKDCNFDNGQIIVEVQGGLAPYIISISEGTTTTSMQGVVDINTNISTAIFNNLTVGTYTVSVTDANNCQSTPQTVEIVDERVFPSITIIPTDITSCIEDNGAIDVEVLGGVPPYVVSVIDGANTYSLSGSMVSFANLAVGTYDVYVTDANACSSSMETIEINNAQEQATFNEVTKTDNTACNELANGSITVDYTSVIMPITLTLESNFYQQEITLGSGTAYTFNGLEAGNYEVYMVNGEGCGVVNILDIFDTAVCCPAIEAINYETELCHGSELEVCVVFDNAIIENTEVSLITSNETYTVAGVVGESSICISIPVTNETCTPIDLPIIISATCQSTTIDNQMSLTDAKIYPAPFDAVVVEPTCSQMDAGGTVTPGLAGSVEIRSADGSFCEGATGVAGETGLCPGPGTPANLTYVFNYFESSVCAQYFEGDFDEPCLPKNCDGNCGLTALGVAVQGVSDCNGTADGEITVTFDPIVAAGNYTLYYTVDGNTMSMVVSLNVDDTQIIISDLGTGTYTGIYLEDATGCASPTNNTVYYVLEPAAVSDVLMIASSNGMCVSNNTTLTASPDVYTSYEWFVDGVSQGAGAMNTITGGMGTYTVVGYDANGCAGPMSEAINIIKAGSITNVTFSNPTGCGADGSIMVEFENASTMADMTYITINDNSGTSQTLPVASGDNSITFTNLSAGVYTVSLQDNNGCTSSWLNVVSLSDGAAPNATVTTSDITHCTEENGQIEVLVAGGTAPYIVSINDGVGTYSLGGSTDPSTITFSDLAAGNYTISVSDANACTSNLETIVIENAQEQATFNEVTKTDNTSCNELANGSITVNYTAVILPITLTLESNFYQQEITLGSGTAYTFNGLEAGNYAVNMVNGEGCGVVTILDIFDDAICCPAIETVNYETDICHGSDLEVCVVFEESIIENTEVSLTTVNNTYTAQGVVGEKSICIRIPATNETCDPTPLPFVLNTTCQSNAIDYDSNLTAPMVYPAQFNAVIEEPTCDSMNSDGTFTVGNDGVIQIVSADGNNICDYANGIAGVTGACPGPGTSANMSYNFTFFEGTVCSQYFVGDFDEPCIPRNCAGDCGLNVISLNVQGVSDCNGAADGMITVNFSPITTAGNYTLYYTVDGIVVSQAYDFEVGDEQVVLENLPVGAYTGFYMEDATGCVSPTNSAVFYVLTPTSITTELSISSVSDCVYSTAVLTASPAIYSSYEWFLGGVSQGTSTDNTFRASPGIYTVVGYDSNACAGPVSATFTLAQSGRITDVTTVDPIGCANDGSITVTFTNADPLANNTYISLTGGNGATYTLAVPDGSNTVTFNNLSANYYFVSLNDDNDCSHTWFGAVSLIDGDGPSITANSYDITDCLINDGRIDVQVTGGTAPYFVSINDGVNIYAQVGETDPSTISFTELPSGTYTIQVEDANGCLTTSTQIWTINNPPGSGEIMSVITTDITSCSVDNGSITVNVEGGVPDYIITIRNTVTNQPMRVLTGNATSFTFTNMPEGTYQVSLTDGDNCSSIYSELVEITYTPNIPVVSQIRTTQLTACGENGDGEIEVTFMVDAYPVTVSLDNGFDDTRTQTISSGPTNTLVNAIFGNLGAGFYTVTITDGEACSYVDDAVLLTPPEGPSILDVAVTASTNCENNGALIVELASTGIAPYTVTLVDQDGNLIGTSTSSTTTQEFENLAPGSYTVTVEDANGCRTQWYQPELVTSPDNVASISLVELDIMGGCESNQSEITVHLNAGADAVGPFTIIATNENGIVETVTVNSGEQTGTFSNIVPGIYTLETNTALGCNYIWTNSTIEIPAPISNKMQIAGVNVTNITDCHSTDGTLTVEFDRIYPGDYILHYYHNGMQYDVPFTIALGETSITLTDLESGVYTSFVTENVYGCVSFEHNNYYIIENPVLITDELIISTFGSRCTNTEFTLFASPDAYTSYAWYVDGALIEGYTDQYITTSGAGEYTVVGLDANACPGPMSEGFEMNESIEITSITTNDPTSCEDDNGGSLVIDISPSTQIGNYTVSYTVEGQTKMEVITITNTGDPITINSLSVGEYTSISVESSSGCKDRDNGTYTINALDGFSISSVETKALSNCDGSNDGSMIITFNPALSGDYELHYTYEGEAYSTIYTVGAFNNQIFLNELSAGLYTGMYLVNDAGCKTPIDNGFYYILEPSAVTSPLSLTANGCLQNGQAITLTASPDVYNTYEWYLDGVLVDTSTDAALLIDNTGAYSVIGADVNGCHGPVSDTYTITEAFNIEEVNVTAVSPCGEPFTDGEMQITLAPSSEVGTYNVSYTYNGFQRINVIDVENAGDPLVLQGLGIGTYANISVSANNGCNSQLMVGPFELMQQEMMTDVLTIDGVECGFGQPITLTASPDVYTRYEWYLNGASFSVVTDPSAIVASVGDYTVIGYDEYGCAGPMSSSFTINPAQRDQLIISGENCWNEEAIQLIAAPNVYDRYEWFLNDASLGIKTDPSLMANQAGVYTIVGWTTEGCQGSINSAFTVYESPTAELTVNAEGCPNGGLVTLTAAPDNYANYQWYLDGVFFSNSSEPLAVVTSTGTYTVMGIAENGCEGPVAELVVETPDLSPLVINAETTCISEAITLTASPDIYDRYEWLKDGVPFAVLTEPETLIASAGNYTVRGYNMDDCSSPLSEAVTIHTTAVITATDFRNPSNCLENGAISVTIAGLAGNTFEVVLYDILGEIYQQATNTNQTVTFDDLGVSTYRVLVMGQGDCEVTLPETISLVNDGVMSLGNIEITEVQNCEFDDGSIQFTVAGGTAPYTTTFFDGVGTYTLTIEDSPATFEFDELSPGTYTFEVTDAEGCSIASPEGLDVANGKIIPQVVDVSTQATQLCTENDGQLTVRVDGGEAPYSVSIRNMTTGDPAILQTGSDLIYTFTDLDPGQYRVTLEDNLGCQDISNNNEVGSQGGDLPTIVSTSKVDLINCGDNADGSITIEFSAQVMPVTLTLANGVDADQVATIDTGNAYTFSGLTDGLYIISIEDGRGCLAQGAERVILELVEGGPEISEVVIGKSEDCRYDGTITVNLTTAGEGPYTVILTNEDGQTLSQGPSEELSFLFENLDAHNYTVVAEDNSGCRQQYFQTQSLQAADDDVIITAVQSKEQVCEQSNEVEVLFDAAANALPPYIVTIIHDDSDFEQSITVDTDEDPVTFTNLPAGSYSLQCSPSVGCPYTWDQTDIIIEETSEPLAINLVSQSYSACTQVGGTLEITVNGGVSFYVVNITGNDYTRTEQILVDGGSVSITNLVEGTYNVEVIDRNDCTLMSDPVNIQKHEDGLAQPLINVFDDINCEASGTEVQLFVNPATYETYEWYKDGILMGVTSENSYMVYSAGSYTAKGVRGDCTSTASEAFTIAAPPSLDLVIVNGETECEAKDGQIDVLISGGSGQYSLVLTAPNGISKRLNAENTMVSFTDLIPTIYSLEVLDVATNCNVFNNGLVISEAACTTEPCIMSPVTQCVEPMVPYVLCPDFCSDAFVITDIDAPFQCNVENQGACVEYTAFPGFTGEDKLILTACEGDANCTTVEVTLIVGMACNSTPPVAVDDQATSNGETVCIAVTNNDQSTDGSNLSLGAATSPNNGSVVINEQTGELCYTPNEGFEGTDNFRYTVCNDGNQCDEAIVTINVEKECEELERMCTPAMTPMVICPAFCELSGNVIITEAKTTFNCSIREEGDRCIKYTALPLFVGEETITITACNEQGKCQTVEVVIDVTGDCEGLANEADAKIEALQVEKEVVVEESKTLIINDVQLDNAANSAIIYLSHTGEAQEVNFILFDLSGRKMSESQFAIEQGKQRFQLDLSALPASLYTLHIVTNEGALTTKLIKQ